MTVKKPKANKKHWRGAPSPDGLSHKKKETVRRCLVTRETLPMNRLIRFCVSPERMVVPDLANKLPGRGMWVTADRDFRGVEKEIKHIMKSIEPDASLKELK